MTKKRDTQRSKVYRAEEALKSLVGSEGLTVPECQALIDKWASSAYLRRHYPQASVRCEVRDGRGHRRAVYYSEYAVQEAGFFTGWRPVIHLPKWARSKLVLAHEYAHHLAPEGAKHDHEWAALYLYLVRVFIGKWAEDELKASFKTNRVKFRPPVKRTMTDAQRQAARERMVALNAQKAEREPVLS